MACSGDAQPGNVLGDLLHHLAPPRIEACGCTIMPYRLNKKEKLFMANIFETARERHAQRGGKVLFKLS